VTELTATIDDIDLAKRMITLKGPGGKKVTTEVSPDVKNLDRVKVGDEVKLQYYLAIMVSAKRVSDDAQRGEEIVASAAATAPAGELPAGVVGHEVRETVEILGTDKYKKAIAFRGADGKFREVSMDAPHLEDRLDEFHEGEKYEVVYREAVAVFVEPK
jgi:hypothetical protein